MYNLKQHLQIVTHFISKSDDLSTLVSWKASPLQYEAVKPHFRRIAQIVLA